MEEVWRDYILKQMRLALVNLDYIKSTELLNGGIEIELDDGQKGLIGFKEDLM